MAKYDVFISCKSEDYKYAEDIYEFLVANSINVFLASKELRKLGESEYRREISKALKDACHIIVFASRAEYIDSTWVYYEWDMFVNAKLKKFKNGNIITILKDVPTDAINMDLWKYESFEFDNYKASLLPYVETDASRARAEEAEHQKLREKELQQKAEEESRRKNELKRDLIRFAEEYRQKEVALSVDGAKIKSQLKKLGVKEKKCPLCGAVNDVDNACCERCGWQFSPLDGIEGLEYLLSYDARLMELRKHIFSTSIRAQEESEKSALRLHNLKVQLDRLSEIIVAKDARIAKLERSLVMKETTVPVSGKTRKESDDTPPDSERVSPLPVSIGFESEGRKFIMVLSEDETYYLGNLNSPEDFSWWENKWVKTLGKQSLVGGALILSGVTLGIPGLFGYAMYKILKGVFSKEDRAVAVATPQICKELSENSGYLIDIPSEAELKGVNAGARHSCVVIRVKDNPRLFEKDT